MAQTLIRASVVIVLECFHILMILFSSVSGSGEHISKTDEKPELNEVSQKTTE